MNFYTDDTAGMKLPPVCSCATNPLASSASEVPGLVFSRVQHMQVMVIVGSVIFILFVTMFHVVGKVRLRMSVAQVMYMHDA